MEKEIEQAWMDFRVRCIPSNVTGDQLATVRRVFYAGAYVMFQKVVIECDTEASPDTHVKKIETIFREMRAFQMETISAFQKQGKGQSAQA